MSDEVAKHGSAATAPGSAGPDRDRRPHCGQCGGPVRYVPLGDLAGVIEQHDDTQLREARELMQRLLQVCGDKSICAGCKRPVFWLKTKAGRPAIFDADGRSHWATCPHSADFRKRQARARSAAGAEPPQEHTREP